MCIKSRNQNVDSKEARNENNNKTILVGELHAAAEINCSKCNLIEIFKPLFEDNTLASFIAVNGNSVLDMISTHF